MEQFTNLLIGVVVVVALLIVALRLLSNLRQIVVFEYERGLMYRDGKIQRVLEPGRYWYFQFFQTVTKMDIRARFITIPGQELITSDNVGLRLTIVANYTIADPARLVTQTMNHLEALHLLLQLQLRDLVGDTTMDDLLAKRKEIGNQLFEGVAPKAAEIGIKLISVGVRDIMFPGELKNAFSKVVTARQEGLAALEKARGESAALRNLANAAKLLENNPQLVQLRLLQSVSTGGNTIVLQMPDGGEATPIVVTPKKTD